ncbi:hypothetical protein Syun_003642 [Stephania yunnanensis]|uniref:Uncharacterized protein n=1 Tax=Stephania yunnanensis TaxID=152371 RepID=A0AAP0L2I8_9MAGN
MAEPHGRGGIPPVLGWRATPTHHQKYGKERIKKNKRFVPSDRASGSIGEEDAPMGRA